MSTVLLYAAAVCLVGFVVTAVLGFLVFPRQVARVRKGPSRARDRQGLARSMCVIFAAGAFTCGFFGFFTR